MPPRSVPVSYRTCGDLYNPLGNRENMVAVVQTFGALAVLTLRAIGTATLNPP